MFDPSKSLEDLFGKEAPDRRAFGIDVLESDLVSTAILHLLHNRCCVLSGSPRSGKTTTAWCVGVRVLNGRVGGLKYVRYLDLASLDGPPDQTVYFPLGIFERSWLLIIDNWHARPDCHTRLNELLNSRWSQGASILYCTTSFPESAAEAYLPMIDAVPQGQLPLLGCNTTMAEVSRWMIDARLRANSLYKAALIADEEDYAQALAASTEHKKIRGNLRFLRWRLAAWRPTEESLRDVTVDAVLRHVRQEVMVPNRGSLPTIERIAAVAQWELPYRRGSGERLPEGIESLERNNVIVSIDPSGLWRMDSTDAYLFLRAVYKEDWMAATSRLLVDYVTDHPSIGEVLIARLLAQAHAEHMTSLILSLLADKEIGDRVAAMIKQGLDAGDVSFGYVCGLVGALMRDFPSSTDEADLRVRALARVLSRDVGAAVGKSARGKSIGALRWMLYFLERGGDVFTEFAKELAYAYGEDNLTEQIKEVKPGKRQKEALRALQFADPELRLRLRARIGRFNADPNQSELDRRINWLQTGTVQFGGKRRDKIGALNGMDESYLHEKAFAERNPVSSLQRLLHIAMWLSPVEAARLAKVVAQEVTNCEVSAVARDWSLLLANLLSADAAEAERVVDHLLGIRAADFLQQERGREFGLLLAMMEKVIPGCLGDWLAFDEKRLTEWFSHRPLAECESMMAPLAVFAGPLLAQVVREAAPSWLMGNDVAGAGFGRHLARGALALAGLDIGGAHDAAAFRLAGRHAADVLIVLYDMKRSSHEEFVSAWDEMRAIPPAAVIMTAQLGNSIGANDVEHAIRRVLRGGVSERTRGLESAVAVTKLGNGLRWHSNHKWSGWQEGHRAIRTAVHEGAIQLRHAAHNQIEAQLNEDHPTTVETMCKVDAILNGLGNRPVTLAEWVANDASSMPNDEALRWRLRFLAWGVVRASLFTQGEDWGILFARSVPDVGVLCGVLGIPHQQ